MVNIGSLASTAAGFWGNLLSGGLSLLSTASANKANKDQWKKQVEFAIHMAKNAHQYEVQDLRKAGLNPILSATGGNGATAQVPAAAPQKSFDVPDFGSSFVNALNSAAALKNIEIQQEAVDSQKAVNAAQVHKIYSEKARIDQEIAIKSSKAELGKVGGDIAKKANQSYDTLKDYNTWDGFLMELVAPFKALREKSAYGVYQNKLKREEFRAERNQYLINRALQSDRKEFYTSNPSLVDAFMESDNWKVVSAQEKDGYGVFVFKNKYGFVKTIHYKLEGWN